MTINFEYIRIDELLEIDYKFSMQQKEFTLDELAQYNGRNGKSAYIAVKGIVYDISNEQVKNIDTIAGKDLTEEVDFYHKIKQIINKAQKIGRIDDNNNIKDGLNRSKYKLEKQKKSKCEPNQWNNYIEPLVKYAMGNSIQLGTKCSNKCNQDVLTNIFNGIENTLKESINQIQCLQCKMLDCTGSIIGIGEVAKGIEKMEVEEQIKPEINGFEGIAGGASGGTGGGFGVAIESTENSGNFESTNAGGETKIGPGAVGGAAGGALGSTRSLE